MSLHQTVVTTPKPRACSTQKRSQRIHAMDSNVPRNNGTHNFNSVNTSSESLGILPLEDMASEFSIEPSVCHTQNRQENLIRKRVVFDMFKSKYDCSEKNESTVNESDLLRDSPMQNTKKKNSTSNESDRLKQSRLMLDSNIAHHSNIDGNCNRSTKNEQMSDNISEIINRFQTNPEASINEILCDFSSHLSKENEVDIDSGMFLTSELAQQQMKADEEELKEKNAWIPHRSRQSCISLEATFDDKLSIGDFFQRKSEQCSSIFGKDSPTKLEMIPLVNSTSIEEDAEGSADKTACSILSVSGIKNVIAGCDSPSKIVERILQITASKVNKNLLSGDYTSSRLSLDSPHTKSLKISKPYSSSIDLRTPNINQIDNKENQLPMIEKNRTLTSVRSTSSLDSMPDNINKLSSTKSELIWGCVKEGRSDIQSVTIRNTNKRRIKYMCQSNNAAFKVLNIDSQSSSDKGIFYLHPMETRELRISFCPNIIGPHVGHLCFTPIIHKQEQTANRSQIPLFGYGGHVNIAIKGQTTDLSGKLWISLGCVDGRQELVTEFVVANTGVIDGFVSFSLNPKALCAFQDIHISPSSAIIKRRTEQLVLVRFRPSKSDLHILNTALSTKSSKSTEIVAIRMISGAEINRQRLIKLYKRFPNEFNSREDIAVLQELSVQFHGERENNEVRLFKESCKSTKNSKIIQYLHSTDISLLVDKDMDSTLLPEVDDSSIAFNTMIDANDAASVLECEKSYGKFFNVEPPKIILTPPAKCVDSLFLTSHYPRPVHFSINVSNQSIMQVRPSHGRIEPGKTNIVTVVCIASKSEYREDVNIFIEIEGDVLTSVITIWPL